MHVLMPRRTMQPLVSRCRRRVPRVRLMGSRMHRRRRCWRQVFAEVGIQSLRHHLVVREHVSLLRFSL